MYKPEPLDVAHIELPEQLLPLIESMARNVHEQWARNRIEEGWRLGQRRDDALKTTPCLIPYEELSQQEREYDRATAIATLKFIMANGFKITK